MKTTNILQALVLFIAGAFAAQTQAVTLNFDCITGNDLSGVSCAIAENQMTVTITDATDGSGDKALFTFSNSGSDLESYISDIYFMDGTLFGISSIDNSDAGVSYSEGADPANLPGYSPTASFSADNDPGAIWGIQAGESLGITFDLLAGVTFADTLAALGTGDLIIGIHAKGLGEGTGDEFSESLTTVVPVPAAVWLFATGLIGLVGVSRKRA